jgi:hypothetical protein
MLEGFQRAGAAGIHPRAHQSAAGLWAGNGAGGRDYRLALRSREARTGAFAIILIAAASAWPVFHYGQQGYDRVKGMSDSEAKNGSTNTGSAASSSFTSFTPWERSRWCQSARNGNGLKALPLAITTLVLAMVALGIGGYIAYAGGHIRHKEFRFELAPKGIMPRGWNGETTQDKHAGEPTRSPFTYLIWYRDCAQRAVLRSRFSPGNQESRGISCSRALKIGKRMSELDKLLKEYASRLTPSQAIWRMTSGERLAPP